MRRAFRAESGIVVEIHELEPAGGFHLTAIEEDRGVACPLATPAQQISGIELLPLAQLGDRCPRQLAPVVGTCRLDSPSRCWTVKQQDDALHLVQVDQILAFRAHPLCTILIGAARRERTSTTGHVESIVLRDLEFLREKCVGRLLQTTV